MAKRFCWPSINMHPSILRPNASSATWRTCPPLKRCGKRAFSPETSGSEPNVKNVLRNHLDAEIQRLPERYRAPLILCYLDHQTREDAAERLGLTSGALHGRLER